MSSRRWKYNAAILFLIPDVPTRTDPNNWDIKQKWQLLGTVNMNGTQPRVRMEWFTICGQQSRSLLAFETRLNGHILRQRRTDPSNGDWSGLRTSRVWSFNMRRVGGSNYRFRLRWRWRTIFATTDPRAATPLITTHLLLCYENNQDVRVCSFDPLYPGSNHG